MTCFEINGRLLLVDCGVLFPEDDHPGVDLILPGLDAIADRLDDVEALVLTHGHEDHIGAVPYLLRQRSSIPIVGSSLTLGFLREKLREHRLRNVEFTEVAEGDRIALGPFDVEFLAVNHSIPDGLAVFIRTAAGTVLHTGDFKMDQLPLDDRLTDLRGFGRLGAEGVDLFMTDSTNAENSGFTPFERDLEPALERVFQTASRRIVVACFASHVHRIQQIMDLAVKHGRKVCYVGRSMVRNMGVARDLGFLKVPGDTLVELAAMKNIPDNENSVYRVINGLSRIGARVVHKGNALVHVSGHASAGELLYCYNIVKPRNVMPVHGEMRHLMANADLAVATGVPKDRVIVAEDGDVMDLVDGKARKVGRIDAGYILVDGASVGGLSEEALA